MGSVFRGIVAVLAAFAFLAEAPPPDEAATIFAQTGLRTSAVRSYTFNVHVDFALRTFPYLAFHLDGVGKYERPNLYSVTFQHVPWFIKGFNSIKMDAMEPVTWPKTYDVVALTHDGSRALIEMKDKTDGHVKGVHAEIDDDGLREVRWSYVNGGVITVDVNPTHVSGIPLPQTERADIQVPGYHITAHASFDGYAVTTDDAQSATSASGAAPPGATSGT
jgi:hypothetical protein